MRWVQLLARGGLGDYHRDAALGHKCKSNSDIVAPCWLEEELLTDEENVDHMQHTGCEEMGVELIENDDDDVDMEPSKTSLVECRESLKDVKMLVFGTKICYKSHDWQTSVMNR